GTVNSSSLADAVDRTRRAVDELHIAGLPTNRTQLLAILARPEVRTGDARTTLLGEAPELATPDTGVAADRGPLASLERDGGHVPTPTAAIGTSVESTLEAGDDE